MSLRKSRFVQMEFHPGVPDPRTHRQTRRIHPRSGPRSGPRPNHKKSSSSPLKFSEQFKPPMLFEKYKTLIPDAPLSTQYILDRLGTSMYVKVRYLYELLSSLKLQETKEAKKFQSMLGFKLSTVSPFQQASTLFRHWNDVQQKRRILFRILLNRWLIKKCQGRPLNTEDPCTLCVPRKQVKVYDMNQRGYYVFEASALKKYLTELLSYDEWLFPRPIVPKNPLTNKPFHLGQFRTLLDQLRHHNQTSWQLEAYSEVGQSIYIDHYKHIFKYPLKIHAVSSYATQPQHETTNELVLEFMEEVLDIETPVEVSRSYLTTLKWAMRECPTDPFLQRWIHLWKQTTLYDILVETVDPIDLQIIQTNNRVLTLQIIHHQQSEFERLSELRRTTIRKRRQQTSMQSPTPPQTIQPTQPTEQVNSPVERWTSSDVEHANILVELGEEVVEEQELIVSDPE